MLESFLGHGTSGYFNHLPSTLVLVVISIVTWVALARSRRWNHYNAIHQKYGPKWDNGRGRITPEEAQAVVQLSTYYDMPFVLYRSYAFALFKTYAIVSLRPHLYPV
jgi:hypothetical protein